MIAKRSFKLKLIFSYFLIVLISFGFISFFLDRQLEEDSLRDIKALLVNQANLIESQIPAESLEKEDIAFLESLVNALSPKIKCRISVVKADGKVLADSERSQDEVSVMENHRNRPEVRTALGDETGVDTRYSSTLKTDMLYVAMPLKDRNEIVGVIRLALPLESVQRALFEIRKTIFMGLLFALGLAFILGSVIAGKIINPINRMINVSRKYSEGDFSRRIMHGSKDEIDELADTLNKMAQDIEDKIKEVRTQNQQLAAIFNSMIEGVIVVDRAGRIVSINPAIEKIFGVSKKDAEGRLFLEAIRNNDMTELINDILKKGEPSSREINLVLPVRGIFQLNATPFFDNQIVNGCLVVIHDITEIRRLETMRSDFVANVSHELKTPLTSIKGFVETLLESALDDKENNRNFLRIIQDHTERLNNLVNDLLALSHLESKEITLERRDFNLSQLADEVVMGFRSQLKEKGMGIKNDLPADLSVKADRERIGQVFTNLIDNAIKFNREKGSIRIYNQDSGGKVKITVEDSGIGIPEKDISRIFERFYRVDKAHSRELGGTGLGLSIVKHIIELHNGSVGVESAEGLGSRFWFTLPG
jgi:two-component system, OmpR family, phosphate regulon sensor histidine kinase PhoR